MKHERLQEGKGTRYSKWLSTVIYIFKMVAVRLWSGGLVCMTVCGTCWKFIRRAQYMLWAEKRLQRYHYILLRFADIPSRLVNAHYFITKLYRTRSSSMLLGLFCAHQLSYNVSQEECIFVILTYWHLGGRWQCSNTLIEQFIHYNYLL